MTQLVAATANEPGASAERRQAETSDLAALRQTVEQLAAGLEQLTREMTKLQAEKRHADNPPAEKPDKRQPSRVSTHPAPAATPARKPAPTMALPPQTARQVATVSALSPPPLPARHTPSKPQPANPAPLRPPMPVP